jgi:hypothetical protein
VASADVDGKHSPVAFRFHEAEHYLNVIRRTVTGWVYSSRVEPAEAISISCRLYSKTRGSGRGNVCFRQF